MSLIIIQADDFLYTYSYIHIHVLGSVCEMTKTYLK